MPTLATEIRSCTAFNGSVPLIEGAARLSMADEVMERVIELSENTGKDVGDMLSEGLVRLPHDPLWLEYGVDLEDEEGNVTGGARLGVLITGCDNAWRISAFKRDANSDRINEFFPVRLGDLGTGRFAVELEKSLADWEVVFYNDLCISTVCAVAILTAHNAPLAIGPAEDTRKLKRVRARRGRTPVLPCQPVRWNLARALRGVGPVTEEDRRRAAAHMVRGHLRRAFGKLFWVRPHFRCLAPGEQPPPGRDYRVGI